MADSSFCLKIGLEGELNPKILPEQGKHDTR